MERFALVIGISKENQAEYERLHADVWPDVLKQIALSNIHNYSIYLYEELLFSYFEYDGNDFTADMEKMAKDPVTQKWWDLCQPLQIPMPERQDGEWEMRIPEIFHVD